MIDQINKARRHTDDLFGIVAPDALYDRPIPERHRIIFYIGHLEAFDWNLLAGMLGLQAFEPEFDHLFAFGIDPVGGGLPGDTPADWPSVARVLEYRSRVRAELDAALSDRSDRQLLHVALEHRLMHAETLAYMFHQLPLDRKTQPGNGAIRPGFDLLEGRESGHEPIDIPEGPAHLGLRRGDGVFGWDNEFDAHSVRVPRFAMDRYKVTNAQFARFVAEGAYDHRSLWTDSAWDWKCRAGISHPVFWVRHNDGWHYRTMFDEIPLPPDWPVYVSHAEAAAYCRWAGKALPTEAQWQRAAEGSNWNLDAQDNIWDPWPVSNSPSGRSAFGIEGLVGNGWEWTSTPFAPFDGFRPFQFYPGYSADFFDGRHFVMKGGSVRTAACMLRPTFRNWFQPHYQYVYAGFRCVSN